MKDNRILSKEDRVIAYKLWIDSRYPTWESALGYCGVATIDMSRCFSSLKRIRGIVRLEDGSEHTHWWLYCDYIKTIVDPTAKQFANIDSYIELPDNDPRCLYPRQSCMQCGKKYFSDRPMFCSKECEKKYVQETDGDFEYEPEY